MRCVSCGGDNPDHARHCLQCGTKLPPAPTRAERRPVTVLFCDLIGSTELSEKLDPEDFRELIQEFQSSCADAVGRHEGHIAQFLGDGLLVYFGYPVAHDDDATRAVAAGLDIVRSLGARRGGQPMQVRVGVHSGLVVVGQVGVPGNRTQLAIGETPNVASRVQGEAAPDSVVITDATARLVEGFFELEELNPRALRGLSRPVKLFRVVRRTSARNRLEASRAGGLTPFVGRTYELGLLQQNWDEARAGRGRMLAIRGEAGVGKSRLIATFKSLIAERPFELLEASCSEHLRNSTLHPITGVLEDKLGISVTTTAEQRLKSLQHYLEERRLDSPVALQVFADLLSVPVADKGPPAKRPRQVLLEQLVSWLGSLCAAAPLLWIVEDIQWADASTLELIERAAERLASLPILLLLTLRPEAPAPWRLRPSLVVLQLGALRREETLAMAMNAAHGKPLPREVAGKLEEWTKGVPLYIEEFTKGLLESGVLREAADRYELSGPLPSSAIPQTLAGPLLARIDRLGEAKPLLQTAAVLGSEFSYGMLRAVAELSDQELAVSMQRLLSSELVVERASEGADSSYGFRHALIREAAYDSLLHADRRERHARIVQAIRTHFPTVAENQPELVAYHCTKAGVTELAVLEWRRAAERALAHAANWEALAYIESGVAELEKLPDSAERYETQLAFELIRGPALMAIRGFAAPEVKDTYRRAHDLSLKIGDLPRLYAVLWGQWANRFVAGDLKPARQLAEQVFRLAETTMDPSLLVPAYHALGYTLCYVGEFSRALELARAGIDLFDMTREQANVRKFQFSSTVAMHHFAALALWMLGFADQARGQASAAIRLARSLDNPPTLAYATSALTWGLPFLLGEAHAVVRAAEEAIRVSEEAKFSLWPTLVRTFRGWAVMVEGNIASALEDMETNFAAFRIIGGGILQTTVAAFSAEATWKAGQAPRALELISDALATAVESADHFYEPELHRIRGEILWRSSAEGPALDAAEASLRNALEVARGQGALSLELRAALSLAALLESRGRGEEGRKLVAGVYGKFTEGFDTAELRAAAVLCGAGERA